MVSVSQATAAEPIYRNIVGANNLLTQINALSAAQAVISGVQFNMPTGNFTTGDLLSVSESATLWNAIFTIYNARLTNYNAQLAAV